MIVWSHGSIKDRKWVVSANVELLTVENATVDGYIPDFGDASIAANSNTVFKNIRPEVFGKNRWRRVSMKVNSITIVNDQGNQETINFGGKQIEIVFNKLNEK